MPLIITDLTFSARTQKFLIWIKCIFKLFVLFARILSKAEQMTRKLIRALKRITERLTGTKGKPLSVNTEKNPKRGTVTKRVFWENRERSVASFV